MHRHWTYRDWLDAYDGPDDLEVLGQGHVCAEAHALWPSLEPWIAHASTCERCQSASVGLQLVPDEVLSCSDCLEAAEFLWTILRDLEHFEPAVARELPRAETFMEELSPLSLDGQVTRVRAEHRYQQWGFCQWLLSTSRQSWQSDPHLSLDRAALAVVVADVLDPDYYHPQWLADLQAKAHAYLANAHRILAEFGAAERHFLIAETKLRQGVGLQAEPRVLSLKASLLIDQYRYNEALALLDRVETFHSGAGATHEIGRLRLQRAMILRALDRPLEAAEENLRAADSLSLEMDPDLVVAAHQNAVACLIQAGQTLRARQLFDGLPPSTTPNIKTRRHWVAGDLLRAEGRFRRASESYERARQGLSELGRYYDAALVTMDMALAAYAAGDDRRVVTCAEEASVLLVRAAAKHEAFAVLTLLFRAIERQTMSRAVLESIRERLATLQPS